MERLTFYDNGGSGERENPLPIACKNCGPDIAGHDLENCGVCDHAIEAVARLAAYEDTGLTPEEVVAFKAETACLRADLIGDCASCVHSGKDLEICEKCVTDGTFEGYEWRGPQETQP